MSEDQHNIKIFTELLEKRVSLLSIQDWTDLQATASTFPENDAEIWAFLQNWIASRPHIKAVYQAMKEAKSSSKTMGPGGSKSPTPPGQESETSRELLINSIIKNSPLSDPPPSKP